MDEHNIHLVDDYDNNILNNYNYLLYVRKYSILTRKTEFYVYGVKTNDIFHTIGEMHYRSFEHIERIDFVELNDENRQTKYDFWKSEGVAIRRWIDTYKIVDGNLSRYEKYS